MKGFFVALKYELLNKMSWILILLPSMFVCSFLGKLDIKIGYKAYSLDMVFLSCAIICFIAGFVLLYKELSASINGNEASYTFSMPLSTGEVLWSKFLIGFIYYVIGLLILLFLGKLVFDFNITEAIQDFYYNFVLEVPTVKDTINDVNQYIISVVIMVFSMYCMIASYIFAQLSLRNIFKKQYGWITFGLMVIECMIYFLLEKLMFMTPLFDGLSMTSSKWVHIIAQIILFSSNMVLSWIMYNKKINIE